MEGFKVGRVVFHISHLWLVDDTSYLAHNKEKIQDLLEEIENFKRTYSLSVDLANCGISNYGWERISTIHWVKGGFAAVIRTVGGVILLGLVLIYVHKFISQGFSYLSSFVKFVLGYEFSFRGRCLMCTFFSKSF